jgi:hypothetical protein
VDILVCFPIAIFKYTSKEKGYSDLYNFLTLNFAYVPRVYVMLLTAKLLRIFREKGSLRMKILKIIGIPISYSHIIIVLQRVLVILHIIACFWVAAS